MGPRPVDHKQISGLIRGLGHKAENLVKVNNRIFPGLEMSPCCG